MWRGGKSVTKEVVVFTMPFAVLLSFVYFSGLFVTFPCSLLRASKALSLPPYGCSFPICPLILVKTCWPVLMCSLCNIYLSWIRFFYPLLHHVCRMINIFSPLLSALVMKYSVSYFYKTPRIYYLCLWFVQKLNVYMLNNKSLEISKYLSLIMERNHFGICAST